MELWIREQTRKELRKVDNIIIKKYDNSTGRYKYAVVYEMDTDYNILGLYSTEKQALDVLDEIQRLLTPTIVKPLGLDLSNINIMCQNIIDRVYAYEKQLVIEQAKSIVYQMPEDKGDNYEKN